MPRAKPKTIWIARFLINNNCDDLMKNLTVLRVTCAVCGWMPLSFVNRAFDSSLAIPRYRLRLMHAHCSRPDDDCYKKCKRRRGIKCALCDPVAGQFIAVVFF